MRVLSLLGLDTVNIVGLPTCAQSCGRSIDCKSYQLTCICSNINSSSSFSHCLAESCSQSYQDAILEHLNCLCSTEADSKSNQQPKKHRERKHSPRDAELKERVIEASGSFLPAQESFTTTSASITEGGASPTSSLSRTTFTSVSISHTSTSSTGVSAPNPTQGIPQSDTKHLSQGAKIGVSVSVGVVALLIVIVAMYIFWKRKRRPHPLPSPPRPAPDNTIDVNPPQLVTAPPGTAPPHQTPDGGSIISSQPTMSDIGSMPSYLHPQLHLQRL